MHWHSLPMQKSHRPHMGPLTKGMPLDIHSNNQTHSSLLFYRVDQSCGEQKPTLNDWKESKEWLSNIWLAPCPRHRIQHLTISQEHPTSPTISKEKLQRGQLGLTLMGQGDWTLETAPSGKGIVKAHSTLSNNFLHTLNINKHDSWDITKPKLVLDHSYTITYPTASLTETTKTD